MTYMSPEVFYKIHSLIHFFCFLGIAFIILALFAKGILYLIMRFILFRSAHYTKYLHRKIYIKPALAIVTIMMLFLIYSINLHVFQKYTSYRPDINESIIWGEWEKGNVRISLNKDHSVDIFFPDANKTEYFNFNHYEMNNGAVYFYDKQDRQVQEMVILLILDEYRLLDKYDNYGGHSDLGFRKKIGIVTILFGTQFALC